MAAPIRRRFVPIYSNFSDHPKTAKLSRILDLDIDCVAGKLVRLWSWAMEEIPSGVIPATDGEQKIADVMRFDGDPGTLVNALVSCRWFERDLDGLRIHDWGEYGGKIERQRQANCDRTNKHRSKHDVTSQPEPQEDVTSHSGGCDATVRERYANGTHTPSIVLGLIPDEKKTKDKKKEGVTSQPEREIIAAYCRVSGVSVIVDRNAIEEAGLIAQAGVSSSEVKSLYDYAMKDWKKPPTIAMMRSKVTPWRIAQSQPPDLSDGGRLTKSGRMAANMV